MTVLATDTTTNNNNNYHKNNINNADIDVLLRLNMTSIPMTEAMIVYGDNDQIHSCMNYDDSSLVMHISTCQGTDLAQVPQRCFAAAAAAACLMIQPWKPLVAERCCRTL